MRFLERRRAATAQHDARFAALVTDELIEPAVACVPGEWLGEGEAAAYVDFLRARRDGGRPWLPGGGS